MVGFGLIVAHGCESMTGLENLLKIVAIGGGAAWADRAVPIGDEDAGVIGNGLVSLEVQSPKDWDGTFCMGGQVEKDSPRVLSRRGKGEVDLETPGEAIEGIGRIVDDFVGEFRRQVFGGQFSIDEAGLRVQDGGAHGLFPFLAGSRSGTISEEKRGFGGSVGEWSGHVRADFGGGEIVDGVPVDAGGSHRKFFGGCLGKDGTGFGAFAEVDRVVPGREIIGDGMDEMCAVDGFERNGVCGDRGCGCGDVVVAAEERRAPVLRHEEWCGALGFEAQNGNFSADVGDLRNRAVAVEVFGIELNEDGGLVLEVPIWQENVFGEDGALLLPGGSIGRKERETFSGGTDPSGDMAKDEVAGGVVLKEGDARVLGVEEDVLKPDGGLCGTGGGDADDGVGRRRIAEQAAERTEIQLGAHAVEKGDMVWNFD